MCELRAVLLAVAAAVAGLVGARAQAATCTWNVASGNWSVVANWSGCADAPGPSTRTPGAGDIAVLANGTANLDASPSVAELELGAGGILAVVGGTKTFNVATALRLNGGKATTILGTNQLLLNLAAGGTGSLLAPTTFENAVFFENSGALALGSASGTALTLLVAAEVRNMPGATITMSGGNSHLTLAGSSKLVNNLGATLTITGNTLFDRPPAVATQARLNNLGTMTFTGPGSLSLLLGTGGGFAQWGDFTATDATVVCNQLSGEACSFSHSNGGPPTGSITRLANATLDLGGATVGLNVPLGSTVTGTGTVNGFGNITGTLAPGAPSGAPYGTLAFTGKLVMNAQSMLDLDLGGAAAGSYDRVQLGGTAQVGGNTAIEGYGVLNLRLAPGYQPALGAALPVMSYTSAIAESAFNRVDDDYALDFAARFDATALNVFPAPRITIDDASVVEGASGSTPIVFNVRLSQASALTVTAQIRITPGTAVYGLTPGGDFLFPNEFGLSFSPGQTLQAIPMPVNGDAEVEGDEAFTFDLRRNRIVNAAVGDHVPGSPAASGTILSDELAPGTRFVLVGKDNGISGPKVQRYTSTGTYIDTWGPDMGNFLNYIATGLCFSPQGTILTTRFGFPNPILYNRTGAVLNAEFGRPLGTFPFNNHESCVFDDAGNVYIGQAGVDTSTDAQVPVKKFDRYGTALDSFVLPTGPRGTDWIDLDADQCTLYYTSEDTSVRRYDLCARSALPVFASGLTAPYCYALRLRPNKEVMVTCQDAVHRLGPDGSNLRTYTRESIGENDASGLFAMNLDPDNSSFWTAGMLSGKVYRVDIASGAVLGDFGTGPGGVSGLGIYDEPSKFDLFKDGFESPAAAAKSLALPASAPAPCVRAFRGGDADMPHYVPRWIESVVLDASSDCVP